jgi:hypothetical protein
MKKKRLGLVLLFSMSILFSCKSNKPEVKIVNKQSDTTSVAKVKSKQFEIKADSTMKPAQSLSAPKQNSYARPK